MKFNNFCTRYGIERQNDLAERMNRTLIERIRSIFLTVGMSNKLILGVKIGLHNQLSLIHNWWDIDYFSYVLTRTLCIWWLCLLAMSVVSHTMLEWCGLVLEKICIKSLRVNFFLHKTPYISFTSHKTSLCVYFSLRQNPCSFCSASSPHVLYFILYKTPLNRMADSLYSKKKHREFYAK